MAGIVVFGGTVEGRMFAEAFCNTDLELHICVATEYGASLLPVCSNIEIHTGRMDAVGMEKFLEKIVPDYCLDATHPYAESVSENALSACQRRNVPYIRVLREEGEAAGNTGDGDVSFIYEDNIEDAAAFLNTTKGNILITTGSKDLEKYAAIEDYKNRCYARVLPIASVLEKCRELGFEGKNLIGMQGPFGEELNYWMMKQIDASYHVTKNSGREGCFQEKSNAAVRAGVRVLVIERRREKVERASGSVKVYTFPEAMQFLRQQYGLKEKKEVCLIGMGPGNIGQLTGEARKCLRECDVVIGAKRMLEMCQGYGPKPYFTSYKKEEIALFLQRHPEYKKAALVYSGDIGFYSGADGINNILKDYKVLYISGISSVQYFLNRLAIPWDKVRFVSWHGKEENLLPAIRQNRWVCVLLGDKDSMGKICRTLLEYHMEEVKITVGERLSYPEENIFSGTPAGLCGKETDALSVLLLENPAPAAKKAAPGLEDSAFARGNVPMTKQEIRILSLAKLGLAEDSVVYDIGAGTGSVSVEAALHCDRGRVYAIEKEEEGARLILENKKRFGAENLTVVHGTAPDCLAGLPAPTHVFIGGSGGRLIEIIQAVRQRGSGMRFVVNAVTLETVAQIGQIRERFPEYQEMEVIQVNVARARELGRYHLMSAENPVYIISFGGRKEEPDD